MAQQTRKDPRAKVLSMTVRYKSATLDEFIEHHSHDVSRGGMFIKTPQPFPPGTLLKFEVRIAEDRKVMQGVGRVVWKRDGATADAERPSGMGVKFIKLDDESRGLIDQLLLARHDETSAYDSEGEGGVDGEARLGLGLTSGHPGARASQAPTEGSTSFFPKLDPAELPPPEDRTVMKQAAELLEEALREVGGGDEPESTADGRFAVGASKSASLAPAISENEETKPGRTPRNEDSVARLPVPPAAGPLGVGRSDAPAAPGDGLGKLSVASASKLVASAKAAEQGEGGSGAKRAPVAGSKPSIQAVSSPRSTRPETPKPKAAASSERKDEPAGGTSAGSTKPPRAAAATAVKPTAAPAPSGGNRALVWLSAVAVSVGVIYYVTRTPTVAAPAPEPPATPEATAVPAAPPADVPTGQALAPSTEPAAPVASAEPAAPVASAEPAAATASAAAPTSAPVPEPAGSPMAAPLAAPKQGAAKPTAPRPKTTAAPSEGPTEPAPAAPPPPPAETKPAAAEVEAKPSAPAAEASPKAAAPAKATPKPAESDNPY